MSKSKLAIGIAGAVLLYIIFNMNFWRTQPVAYDSANYYLYLPATIIYEDAGKLEFYPEIVKKYNINFGKADYGIFPQSQTGRTLNKYAIGTAVFEMPLFLVTHAYCKLNSFYPADGFSPPYQLSVSLSGLLWLLVGLCYLRLLLLRYVNETVTAFTLILIVFATNVYFYTAFSYGMSHIFSCCAVCMLLYATDSFYRTGRVKHLIGMGVLCGLITILRPVNLLFALVPFCWAADGKMLLANRVQLWVKNRGVLVVAAMAFVGIVSLQLMYYKYVTGSYFFYSYQKERFDFSEPHVIDGLFGYAKGWFVYTPLALIALFGLVLMKRKYSTLSLLILFITCVDIYIVFCWWDWEYGGGFSARALIELWPLLALPLAMLVQYVGERKDKLLRVSAFAVAGFCVVLNIFQSYQLADNITVWAHTNKAFYWRAFGNLNVTAEDKKLLESGKN